MREPRANRLPDPFRQGRTAVLVERTQHLLDEEHVPGSTLVNLVGHRSSRLTTDPALHELGAFRALESAHGETIEDAVSL